MVEVEVMIKKQLITILIDLGASNSYIDPNLVERFHYITQARWMLQYRISS